MAPRAISSVSVGDGGEQTGPAPDLVTHYLGLLDQLASELIAQGKASEVDEDYTEEYGERVRSGVRALARVRRLGSIPQLPRPSSCSRSWSRSTG